MPEQERHIQTVCLMILAGLAVAAGLYLFRGVLIPFVVAIFFMYAITPLVDIQVSRLRVPRYVAILSTVLVSVLIFAVVGRVMSTSISMLINNADVYKQRFEQLADQLDQWAPLDMLLPEIAETQSTESDLPTESVAEQADPTTATLITPDVASWQEITTGNVITLMGGGVQEILLRIAGTLLGLLSQGFLILIFLLFLLLGERHTGKPPDGFLGAVESRVRRYIVIKTFISALTGVLVGVVLSVLGVDLAMAFGLFAFLLNFIPSIGSIIATLLPLPVVLLSPALSGTLLMLAIVLPGAVQITLGNIVEPKMMGRSLDLHPVTVLLALIFWGSIWGMVGMFLATPMTAVIKIFFEQQEQTRPLANMLAGRLDSLNAFAEAKK
ncbi:MAG: AI-2E family transporter [Candidatus Competibacteraceae bacterium]|jgi:AI-2 transport protein TqsA|nr:AI-2E family transporter [Candidatus Competibacteraceae bacterium]